MDSDKQRLDPHSTPPEHPESSEVHMKEPECEPPQYGAPPPSYSPPPYSPNPFFPCDTNMSYNAPPQYGGQAGGETDGGMYSPCDQQPNIPETGLTDGRGNRLVVVRVRETHILRAQQQPQSYTLPILVSCIVTWFCCFFVGLVAYALAVSASQSSSREEARKLVKASYGMSVSGIVIGVIILAVVLAFQFQNVKIDNDETIYG